MSEFIYKPYATVTKEWAEICERLREAQIKIYETQNPLFESYPSDEMWNEYLNVSQNYDSVREEMDAYRKAVRFSD